MNLISCGPMPIGRPCPEPPQQQDQADSPYRPEEGLSVESAHLKLLYRLPYNTLNPR